MQYSYLENKKLEDAIYGYSEFLAPRIKQPETEMLPVTEAFGRITARACRALLSSPGYNACAMDGIAVKAEETFGATELTPVEIDKDRFRIVDTGDPVPEGFDAVAMIEDVSFDGERAVLYEAVGAWNNVRQIGEDLCREDIILPSYTKLTPAAIGALLAGGVTRVEVFKRIRAGVIPTGDELIPVGETPGNGEIIEFNSHIFRAALIEAGCEVNLYGIVRDKPELLKNALLKAAGENDIVLLNAGSSAGRDDYSKNAIDDIGEVFCHGIAIRPGKPAVLGVCGSTPVVGLPGYPVSALVVLEQVVFPVIELMTKNATRESVKAEATLSRKVTSSLKYQEFLRVKLGYIGEKLIASPIGRGAGAIASLAKADGVAVIPFDSEGLDTGESVEITLLRPLDEIRRSIIITGSHDPMLDVIGDILRRRTNFFLSSAHVGSMGGIMAMLRGEAHIAPIHLLDSGTGEYNVSYIEKYFKDGDVTLIKGVKRVQGILVREGNPKGIFSIADIAKKGVTYVNRQKGAGTRLLLDYLLEKAGLPPSAIYGYGNEEYTHTAVAAQIAGGNADAGLGIFAVSKIFGLGFIPIADEEYDFLIKTDMLGTPLIQAFLEALGSGELKSGLKEMGGYEF